MKITELTTKNSRENYWGEKKKVMTSLLITDILNTMIKHLPPNPNLKILEIGGAPGDVLIFLTNRLNYIPSSLDYSSVGNQQTIDNFKKAGLQVEMIERNLFADEKIIPDFDIVYSLGFIEHFDNLEFVVEKHLDYLKPGGILILGIPNLLGIYHWFLKRLAPSHDKTHNLAIMDINNWTSFEKKFHLNIIFRKYIGGFEPLKMKKYEVNNLTNKILYFIV
jgi:SAM-dependent methyltransferase